LRQALKGASEVREAEIWQERQDSNLQAPALEFASGRNAPCRAVLPVLRSPLFFWTFSPPAGHGQKSPGNSTP
jgi:hypothetical protein